jgi:hypothetical protein
LDQLPPLAELHDIPELEPQLDLDARLDEATDVVIPAQVPATAALDDSDTNTELSTDRASQSDAPEHTA